MTDLKERFRAATLDEPPFRTRVSDAARRGRFEQRRRLAVGSVGGVAVAAVAVTAVVSVQSPGSRDSLSVPGGGSATSTSISTGPVSPAATGSASGAATSATQSAPTSRATSAWDDDASLNAIFAARQAHAARLVAAVRTHLEDSGYTVQTVSADLSADMLMAPLTPAGHFQIRAGVSQGTDFWELIVGADNVPDYKGLRCAASHEACTLQTLPGGGQLFTDVGVATVFASNGDLRAAGVGDVSGDTANAALLPRSVLVSIVKDPAFDLSDVPRFTAAQEALVQADWDARHASTPTSPPEG